MKLAQGRSLDIIGDIFGIKRRFFGLEPDCMLRRRVHAAIISTSDRWEIDWLAVAGWALVVVLVAVMTAAAWMYAMIDAIVF